MLVCQAETCCWIYAGIKIVFNTFMPMTFIHKKAGMYYINIINIIIFNENLW